MSEDGTIAPNSEAPYGYKKDGTPRKSPASTGGRPLGQHGQLRSKRKERYYASRDKGPNPLFHDQRGKFKKGKSGHEGVGYLGEFKAWKQRLRRALEKFLGEDVFSELLCEAKVLALDRGRGNDQVRMLEFLLEQGVGKATSRMEIETENKNLTLAQRIEMAKVAAGIIQAVTVTTLEHPALPPPPVPAPVIDGEVIEPEHVDAGGLQDSAAGNDGLVPALPAEVHRGQE